MRFACCRLICIKLLWIARERSLCVGGNTAINEVDIRIVAATNNHLEEMVKKGAFREDLYYRLNVVTLNIPPL
ncbi:sigma 54-interacting transcriptional regulator [Bacillus atrophaeus]|uniref:sigma 54-interacting transcriptional regulator n=1 Tax=Bacillus atrophaeus TaxID=1452 RepID=UPI003BF51CC4